MCVAGCCKVLQGVAGCGRVWQGVARIYNYYLYGPDDRWVLQRFAASCSVLQYVVVCCSMLQCVAVCIPTISIAQTTGMAENYASIISMIFMRRDYHLSPMKATYQSDIVSMKTPIKSDSSAKFIQHGFVTWFKNPPCLSTWDHEGTDSDSYVWSDS